MNSESAAARRRRRVYHQRSLQGSGGSMGQYTQQLIPEADNEEDEDDEDMHNEHTSLIRAGSGGSDSGGAPASPRPVVGGRHHHRLQHLRHQHSAPPGGDWGSSGWESATDCLEYELELEAERGGGGGRVEELFKGDTCLESGGWQQQQQQQQYAGSLLHPPPSPHHTQQQSLTAAAAATAASARQGAARKHQWGEEQDSSMTITPTALRAGGGGDGGGGGAPGVSPAGSVSASAAVITVPPSGVGTGGTLALPPVAAGNGGGGGGSGGGSALSPTPGGGAGGGGPRTPVIKKRTRFHQRSVTMMPSTSPVMGPGVVSDEVGLLEREGHHQQLDLAATYHGGGGSSGGSHRYHHHHHPHHHHQRGKTGPHQRAQQRPQAGTTKTSTPSLLFTKVKERIREKVFQSSEWPNAAAMIQERRQRANDLLEASLNSRTNLNLEQIHMHGKQRKKTLTTTLRCKSDSGKYPTTSTAGGSQPALHGEPLVVAPSAAHSTSGSADTSGADDATSPDKEIVRDAFRRRSISEDTYDRPPQHVIMKKNGVVCSNEDLEVIMQDQQSIQHSKAYRTRRSPRPLKKHLRTQSLDIARLTARENQAGGPGHCSHSSIYLDPQVSMESSSSTVSSIRTIDSASSEVNLRSSNLQLQLEVGGGGGRADSLGSPGANLYPEIVLDDKSKETIMEETKDPGGPDGVSQDEGDEVDTTPTGEGKKKAKPVPEIIFDENGQTWDVYGAEFDPEVLGIAIQRHLEKMMERMMAPTIIEEEAALTSGGTCGAGGVDTGQMETRKSEPNSFWVRLLCLFAGRNDVAT